MSRDQAPAPVLDDIGFATKEGVAECLRRASAQQQLAIASRRHSIANLLQVISHRVQQNPDKRADTRAGGDLLAGYRKGIIANRAIERIGCGDMREDQLLESVDAVLQFLELALRNPGHGESPVADDGQPTAAAVPPHRLSETPE